MASLSTDELRLVASRIYAEEAQRVAAELSCSVPRVLVAGTRNAVRQRTAQLVSEIWSGLAPVIEHASSEAEALSFDVTNLWVAILHDERGAFDAVDVALRQQARCEHAEFVVCRGIGADEDLERMYRAGLHYSVRDIRLPQVLPHVLRSIEYRREMLPTAIARHRTSVKLCAEYGENVAAAAGYSPPAACQPETIAEAITRAVVSAWVQERGNASRAAAALDVTRPVLSRLIDRHAIQLPRFAKGSRRQPSMRRSSD